MLCFGWRRNRFGYLVMSTLPHLSKRKWIPLFITLFGRSIIRPHELNFHLISFDRSHRGEQLSQTDQKDKKCGGGFTSFVAYRPTTTKNRTHSLNHFCHFLIFFKSVCKRWKKMKRSMRQWFPFRFLFFFFGRSSPVAFGALTRIEWNAGKVGQFLRYESAKKNLPAKKETANKATTTHTRPSLTHVQKDTRRLIIGNLCVTNFSFPPGVNSSRVSLASL